MKAWGPNGERWWRDDAELGAAIAQWRSEREAALCRAISRATRTSMPAIRAAVTAWATLWRYVDHGRAS
jgi:hypothetical protein